MKLFRIGRNDSAAVYPAIRGLRGRIIESPTDLIEFAAPDIRQIAEDSTFPERAISIWKAARVAPDQ